DLAAQIETARRFASGPERTFRPGEIVFDVGQRATASWLVLQRSIDVGRRDGLNNEAAITTHHPGQFSGEISQLAGHESLAQGRAGAEGCTALPFDAAHVRALMKLKSLTGERRRRALHRVFDRWHEQADAALAFVACLIERMVGIAIHAAE